MRLTEAMIDLPCGGTTAAPARQPRARRGGQVTSGVGEYHGPDRLVVFDVAGAAAKMTVERLADRGVELGACHRRLCQALQQHLALVHKSGRAIAALKREMFDERLLQQRELAVLR